MKFIQIMEFEGDPEDAENALQSYIEKADGRSYARKATICVDRDSGKLLQLIEFDSWEAVSYTHLTLPTICSV